MSSARNLGIERSEGAYITFIDSAEWVDSDYLEVLYSAILEEQADIAVPTYKKFNTSDNCWYFHSFQVKYDRKVFTNIELINELVYLRLERIAMISLKGYDISQYIQQHRFYLDYWHRVAEEQGLGNSIETKRLEELDYLLTGKIYEEK